MAHGPLGALGQVTLVVLCPHNLILVSCVFRDPAGPAEHLPKVALLQGLEVVEPNTVGLSAADVEQAEALPREMAQQHRGAVEHLQVTEDADRSDRAKLEPRVADVDVEGVANKALQAGARGSLQLVRIPDAEDARAAVVAGEQEEVWAAEQPHQAELAAERERMLGIGIAAAVPLGPLAAKLGAASRAMDGDLGHRALDVGEVTLRQQPLSVPVVPLQP